MFITIIAFILILGFLVFVHELGHFLAAKKFNIEVEEFAIGFPPRLFSKKIGETEYALNLIPAGGYVKIVGEDGEQQDNPRSFSNQAVWKRVIVIIAGVTMNIIAAWALLVLLFMIGAPTEITPDIAEKYVHNRRVVVEEVVPNSPAAEASLQLNDIITSVNGTPITYITPFQEAVGTTNKTVEITYTRNNTTYTSILTPQVMQDIDPERKIIGAALAEVGTVRYPPHKAVVAGSISAYSYAHRIVTAFGEIFARLFTGKSVGDSVGGPVAIAVATNDVLDLGFSHVLIFTAILSFNLAIINILPFPALDGGRLVFLIAEKLRGKPSRKEIEGWFHKIGFLLLMLLAIVVTYRDIVRFGGRIWRAIVG